MLQKTKIFNIWFAKISDPLTAKMRHFKIWVVKNIHLNGIYNYSEYLQHSYSVCRGHLSTSFQWILTTQLQYLQGSSLHLIPLALLPQSIQVGQQSPSNVTTLLHLPMSGQGFLWQVTLPRSHIHFSQDDDIGTKVLPVT